MGWDIGFEDFLSDLGGIRNDIILTGYVSNEVLSCLYRDAIAFAYISFYEGFGLPILEAMSFGKAVICSDQSSMPEVGGDAVEYCNPYDIESIMNAMESIIDNDNYRKCLEGRAVVQANKFSYKRTAEEILRIYDQFL